MANPVLHTGRAEGRVGEALEIISVYARRKVDRDATVDDTFRDLRIDDIDRTCIAVDLEDEVFCRPLTDEEIEKWCSVADVLALVGEGRCG